MQIMMFSILFVIVTIAVYLAMNLLYFKYHKAFFIPILTTTVGIILILVLFKVPYETYMLGGKWVDFAWDRRLYHWQFLYINKGN